jgi:hypothetical protein
MRLFPHPDFPWTCPVCGLDIDDEVVLVGMVGTEDGAIMEAAQVHFKCLDHLRWHKDDGMIVAYAPHKEVR